MELQIMTQLAFSFDVSRCSACMACVVTCMDQNDEVADDVAFRHVTKHEEGEHPSVKISSLSLACCHCGDAPCLIVCPTGALFRHDGSSIVDLNRDLCIGCHSCELACAFGAPKFSEDGKMAKCDMCYPRLSNDMQPACVLVCSTGALTVDTPENISRLKAEKASVTLLKSINVTS